MAQAFISMDTIAPMPGGRSMTLEAAAAGAPCWRALRISLA
jgi:hypothetical protein